MKKSKLNEEEIEVVEIVSEKVKLAPIFAKKVKEPKVIESPEVIEARKAFLLSSVPEKLRTQIMESSKTESESLDSYWDKFSEIGHIQTER